MFNNKTNKSKLINSLIIYVSIIAFMLISLFASNQIEILFKLKPNLLSINQNATEVHFVDVGQGDAILIRFSDDKTMIVDSGESKYEKYLLNYINNVFFRDDKNKKFDFALLTHSDSDHSGNMVAILNNYEVGQFFRPKILIDGLENELFEGDVKYDNNETYCALISKLYELKLSNKTKVEFSTMDSYITLNNNAYVHILSPVKNYYSNTNEYSPIIVFENYGVKFMLTGDSTKDNELEVMNNYDSSVIDVDVLKLAHHGSNTSTSLEFLNATSPKYAIISVGEENTYGHPSRETLNNIATYNENSNNEDIKIKQTQNLGNIICYVNDDGVLNFTNILNADDYLFVDWWIIVLCLILIVSCLIFLPILLKSLKKGKTK